MTGFFKGPYQAILAQMPPRPAGNKFVIPATHKVCLIDGGKMAMKHKTTGEMTPLTPTDPEAIAWSAKFVELKAKWLEANPPAPPASKATPLRTPTTALAKAPARTPAPALIGAKAAAARLVPAKGDNRVKGLVGGAPGTYHYVAGLFWNFDAPIGLLTCAVTSPSEQVLGNADVSLYWPGLVTESSTYLLQPELWLSADATCFLATQLVDGTANVATAMGTENAPSGTQYNAFIYSDDGETWTGKWTNADASTTYTQTQLDVDTSTLTSSSPFTMAYLVEEYQPTGAVNNAKLWPPTFAFTDVTLADINQDVPTFAWETFTDPALTSSITTDSTQGGMTFITNPAAEGMSMSTTTFNAMTANSGTASGQKSVANSIFAAVAGTSNVGANITLFNTGGADNIIHIDVVQSQFRLESDVTVQAGSGSSQTLATMQAAVNATGASSILKTAMNAVLSGIFGSSNHGASVFYGDSTLVVEYAGASYQVDVAVF